MDPVSLILGALAAGALKGAGETAGTAVKDAYNGLKSLVAKRFKGKPGAELALTEHESDPDTWALPLEKALKQIDVAADDELVAAAQQLMGLVDPAGAQTGKYAVVMNNVRGAQVGDHNTQFNTFN